MIKKPAHFHKLPRDERGVAYCAPREVAVCKDSPASPPSHPVAVCKDSNPLARLAHATLADRELPDGTLPKD
jgi:hypothetical protein